MEKYRDKLMIRALYLTRNQQDAKDIVQETICRALEGGNKHPKKASELTWLKNIMRNIYYDQISKQHFTRKSERAFYPLKFTPKATDNDIDPALTNLPQKQKECFRLYLYGHSYKQIAEILKISVNTVHFHLKLAKKTSKLTYQKSPPQLCMSIESGKNESIKPNKNKLL